MDKGLLEQRDKLFRKLARNFPDHSTIDCLMRVPRERFVPLESRHKAYLDIPLSIGDGQTISQPYIVALMTQELGLQGQERVLEVGTGSGYQTAILAELLPGGSVVSTELVPRLAEEAGERLRKMGYANAQVLRAGDILGCPELGPYDAILVTAAAPRMPQDLVDQLAVGGRLVAPVGTREKQVLTRALRTEEGISIRMLTPCRFVPLLGEGAFPRAG